MPYTVKVTNRFKGLALIECLKNYGQRFVQVAVTKTIPKKKKCKKEKWLPEEDLKIVKKRRDSKRQRRKGTIYPSESRVPKNSKER